MPDFDFSELTQLSQDLGTVPARAIPKVRQAVEIAARKTKDAWRQTAQPLSGKHARQYPGSIDYDLELNTDGQISAEIGPNLTRYGGKSGRGGLAPSLGILEDAPGGVRSKPQRAGQKAAQIGGDDLETGIAKALEDLL